MKTSSTKQAYKTAPTIDWSGEVVLPKYADVLFDRDIELFRPTGDFLTYADWVSVDDSSDNDDCRDDPCGVIRRLVIGRIHAPPYPWTGEDDRMPVLAAEEVLDLVGVGSPTPLHVQVCACTLQGLLGKPKKYRGRDRWLVLPREDDLGLSRRLSRQYPLPRFHPFSAQLGTRDMSEILARNSTLHHLPPTAATAAEQHA